MKIFASVLNLYGKRVATISIWCLNIYLQAPPHTSAIASTTTTPAVAPQVASTTTTTAVIGQPPPRHQTATVLSRQPVNPNGHNNQIPATVVSASPATTIVTVVPSAKVCLLFLRFVLLLFCLVPTSLHLFFFFFFVNLQTVEYIT